MPRKDPISGVMVMTDAEFWANEARREGKGRTGSDLAADFHDDVAKEVEEERQQIKNDPAAALNALVEVSKFMLEDWKYDRTGPKPPMPVQVTTIDDVDLKWNYRASTTVITGQAICSDGITRKFKYTAYTTSGSRMEPPDSEENLEWQE